MRDADGDRVRRHIQQGLFIASIAGSLVFGWLQTPLWLLMPPLGYLAFLYLDDRAIRMQIGTSAWPSVGYARFQLGTNLYHLIRGSALAAAAYALSAVGSAVAG